MGAVLVRTRSGTGKVGLSKGSLWSLVRTVSYRPTIRIPHPRTWEQAAHLGAGGWKITEPKSAAEIPYWELPAAGSWAAALHLPRAC